MAVEARVLVRMVVPVRMVVVVRVLGIRMRMAVPVLIPGVGVPSWSSSLPVMPAASWSWS
ncbi:MAG: hypothetical protein M5U33_03980 [Pseudorhodoplanes sp.]|nr:hypothetical protein [Pseudorhodoplanes sp.]